MPGGHVAGFRKEGGMTTGIGMALDLMRQALELLDSEGETHIAAYLQGAIDAGRGEKPMRIGDELDPALIELFEERYCRRSLD